MCVIAICNEGKRLDKATFKACFTANDDGCGMAWMDGDLVGYAKGYMKKRTAWEMYKQISSMPHVVHFRLSSAGGVHKELTHPFIISQDSPISMYGLGKDELLFHNGTITDWKNGLFTLAAINGSFPEGHMSDTRFAAMAVSRVGDGYLSSLGGKFVICKKNGFVRYGDWSEKNGIYFSNLFWEHRGSYTCSSNSSIGFNYGERYWDRNAAGQWTRKENGVIVKDNNPKQTTLPTELRGSGSLRVAPRKTCRECHYYEGKKKCTLKGEMFNLYACTDFEEKLSSATSDDDLTDRSCDNCYFYYDNMKCVPKGELKDLKPCSQWEPAQNVLKEDEELAQADAEDAMRKIYNHYKEQ